MKKNNVIPDNQEYRMYDYAKSRVKQKRLLLFHFILFIIGSILMFCINNFVQDPVVVGHWWMWAVSVWAVLLLIHVVNVVFVERFMNRAWQDREIKRLIDLQRRKIDELRKTVEKDFPLVNVQRDLAQGSLLSDKNQGATSSDQEPGNKEDIIL